MVKIRPTLFAADLPSAVGKRRESLRLASSKAAFGLKTAGG